MSPPRPAPPPGVLSPAWSDAPEPLPGGRGVGWEARPALASVDLAGSSEVPFSTPSEGAPAPFPPLRSIGLRGLHRRTIRPAALHWLRACPHAHAPSLPPCALSSHCLGSLRRTLAHPCVRHPSARARVRARPHECTARAMASAQCAHGFSTAERLSWWCEMRPCSHTKCLGRARALFTVMFTQIV